ncbi:MAG: ASKHA domain-containing protein [Dehalococcoidales bacterium]
MARNPPDKNYSVHFEPDNIDIVVEPGANLMETAIAAGVHINASCGGASTCGTCNVVIKKGKVETKRTDKVSDIDYARGTRQSCQSRVVSDLTVEIPVESRLEKEVLAREKIELVAQMPLALATGWQFNPPVSKLYIELPAPTMKDNKSDLSRLLKGLRQQYCLDNISVDFAVAKKLARALRDGDWKVTVTTLLDTGATLRLTNVEPGDTRARYYSLAFDIGTTAVRGQLLELRRGKVLAQSIDYNKQISYGEDVITRIACCQKTGGLRKLQRAAVATINGLIKELLEQVKVEVNDIAHMVVAANTVMVQLLLGLDPQYVRLSPYVPTISTAPLVKASSLGIELADHTHLYALPSVASYVGGDIVGGILGTGVYQRKTVTLYIDIGTNGEIVVGNSDWMVTASCSAGPTFEGGGVKHGMIATTGAIEGFTLTPELEPVISTIGGTKAKGICGSGLINIAAAMLGAGIISQNGKYNTDLPTERLRQGEDGYEYVLARAAETQIGKDIVFTEVDINNLIRSKAAMYAGCQTLIRSVGAKFASIEQVIIAGTFGSRIDIESAITIGLLPDLPRDRFIFIGNGSLLGARLTSFSTDLLGDGQKIAAMMTNLELSENADFMNNYVAALFLPHTNADEFPSVKIKSGVKA